MGKLYFKRQQAIARTPAFYGAEGDGVADDTAALIAWGAWAFGVDGSTNLFWDLNATYKTTADLEFRTSKAFNLNCMGATINRDYAGDIVPDGPIIYALAFRNEIATITTNLAQPITQGDTEITVTDATGAEIGDKIYVQGGLWKDNGIGSTSYTRIILAEVTNIVGNVITISEPSPLDFSVLTIGDLDPVPVRFSKMYSSKIANLKLTGENYLNEDRAGDVNTLLTYNYDNQIIENVDFLLPAFTPFKPRDSYRCRYINITSLQDNFSSPSQGVYGFGPDGQVETTFENCSIESSSHSIVMTLSASYKTTFDNLRAICDNSDWAFDGHGSESVYAINSNLYGIAHGYGLFDIQDSNLYPSLGGGVLAPVCDYIYRFRSSNVVRQPIINISNCNLNSNGDIELVQDGGIKDDIALYGSVLTVSITNSVIDNKDLKILPYYLATYTGLQVDNGVDPIYSLPNHIGANLTPTWVGSYYSFLSATQGIYTPVNLSARKNFSMVVKARLDDAVFGGAFKPLASSSVGSINFWFGLVEDGISFRVKDSNADGTTMNVIYVADTNIRDYGFTFDGDVGVRFFVDGFYIGKVDYTGGAYETSDHLIEIGERNGNIWDGDIKTVAFYDKTLTDGEMVTALTNPSGVSNLIMHLADNKTGATWIDETVNNNDGTVGTGVQLLPA